MSENPNPELPTAGRRPPHAEDEESTPKAVHNRTTAEPEDSRAQSTPSRGEATTRLTPPPPPAPDEEPTAPLARPSTMPTVELDEPTAPLARPSAPPASASTPAERPGAGRPADEIGEATRRLTSPTPPAPSGSDDDEVTARLDQPADPSRPDGSTPPVTPARPPDPDGPLGGVTVSPEPVTPGAGAHDVRRQEAEADRPEEPPKAAAKRRMTSAGTLIALLLALFGFTLVVQLRSNDGDQGLATARQEDLVRILSDLDASDSRLQSQINALEQSQRQLSSGVAGRQAALAEAQKRADELGLLAGTLPGRGPGLVITLDRVKASAILNAVQELRGAGGEVLQLTGSNGLSVRIVASSYFVDAEGGGIIADSAKLAAPYTLSVIGQPQTMQTALQIPGGVVASVNSGGGSVTLEQRSTVEVTAVRKATTLQYAKPAS
jgi:uncharacterized protein YlxW (UPF0749 family)